MFILCYEETVDMQWYLWNIFGKQIKLKKRCFGLDYAIMDILKIFSRGNSTGFSMGMICETTKMIKSLLVKAQLG